MTETADRRNTQRGRRVETPASRAGDAASSREAEDLVTRTGIRARHQRLIAALVGVHPGCTSRELSQHCKLDRWEIARRLPECETAGTVRRGERRRCNVGSTTALTWWPA